MGRWSRGMIPRLQRGDQEFESPPAHFKSFVNSFIVILALNRNEILFKVLFQFAGRWSRGMIPRSHRGDQEFESPPAHSIFIFIKLIFQIPITIQ